MADPYSRSQHLLPAAATPASASMRPLPKPGSAFSVVRSGAALGDRSASLAAFLAAIDRLAQAVELETESLEQHRSTDLKDFNARKSQGLLELSRAMRAIDGMPADPVVAERLGALRAKLEKNTAVLKMHMDAVGEIASMMSEAIQDAESDGTYSARSRLAGAPR